MNAHVIAPTDAPFVLPQPRLDSAGTLGVALKRRRSTRAFLPLPLSFDQVSALLWAAFGVNRPETGGRTAPSARNWQEIEVYAVLAEGTWKYEPHTHSLELARAGDMRHLAGMQDFVATAPLNLIYVVDFDRMEGADEKERLFMAGADTGCIVENVYLYCASVGLASVVRGLVDRRQLAQMLTLNLHQRIALAQTVGYPSEPIY